jgi:hypothetical protein
MENETCVARITGFAVESELDLERVAADVSACAGVFGRNRDVERAFVLVDDERLEVQLLTLGYSREAMQALEDALTAVCDQIARTACARSVTSVWRVVTEVDMLVREAS